MQTHRLIIHHHDRLWGHFDSSVPWSLQAVQDLAARLPEADGYRLELLVSRGEQRLLESSPDGVRVLYSNPLFIPVTLSKEP